MTRTKIGDDEGYLVLKHILRILRIGKFPLIKVIGHPGTGKSGVCIRLGELLNKRLHNSEKMPVDDIVDNLEDLIKLVIETKKEDRKVVIIEEMSTLFNNRRFMQTENITANSLFDTMRKKGMIVIGNYPITKTVDSHIEKSFNCEVEALRLDKTNKEYFVKAKILQTNPGTGKTYSHFFTDDEGRDFMYFRFKWCNKKTFEEYDLNKDRFMKETYELMLLKNQKKKMQIEKLKEEIQNGGKDYRKPLTDRQKEIMGYIGQGLKYPEIMEKCGIKAASTISTTKDNVFKKGYTLAEFKSDEQLTSEMNSL
ncbi:MAG: AAA family ATPase [Spirochaetia bacterium]|nr:AAA family ATPase [Spirochaetia bacterium]